MKREKYLKGVDGRYITDPNELHLVWNISGYHFALPNITHLYLTKGSLTLNKDHVAAYKKVYGNNSFIFDCGKPMKIEAFLKELLKADLTLVAVFEGKDENGYPKYMFQWRVND